MAQNDLPKKILFVDDDVAVSEGLEAPLRNQGVQLVRALDLDTAMYHFNQQIFEVIVVELEFSSLPGLALIQKFRANPNAERRSAGIILTSGQQRKNTDDAQAKEIGDIDVVLKPLTAIKLLPALQRALDQKRLLAEFSMVQSLASQTLAKEGVEAAIEVVKKNLPRLKNKGHALMIELYEEAKQYPNAINVLDPLIEKLPADINLVNTKGRILLKMGDVKAAKEYLEKADAAAPHNIERLKAMASMYLNLEDPDASVEKMKDIIRLSPEQKDLKFAMFKDLESAGYMNHAIGLCKSTTPPVEVVRYYNNVGVTLAKTQDFAGAIAEYESALKFYPSFRENYRIYFNIGLAHAHQKSQESYLAAEQALLKCLDLKPGYEKAVATLVEVRKRLAKKTA